MLGSSENSNNNFEGSDGFDQKLQNPENTGQNLSAVTDLSGKFNMETLAEKLSSVCLKSSSTFDDEKWSKICKITKNILLANVKQYTEGADSSSLSSMEPVVLSSNLNVPSDYTVSDRQASFALWDTNTLEFISLAALNRSSNFTFCFKLVESAHSRPKYVESTHAKHKIVNKAPPITIQGKQFKYDSTQLISLIQKSQRHPMSDKMPVNEPKGRILEKFNLKTEVKIPPNWDKKVGYDENKWDMPTYNTGSIFSLGPLNDRKVPNNTDMESATSALKNLSCLVQDFQVGKKNQSEGSSDDLTNLNINDINNFSFVDEDVDDSLKCSKFSKFFKVLKDQQDNQ